MEPYLIGGTNQEYTLHGFPFQQQMPEGAKFLKQHNGGGLLYDFEGRTYIVPNIWYNQPIEWRIAAMTNEAEAIDKRADARQAKVDAKTPGYWQHEVDSSREQAKKIRAMVEEMKRNGKVIV